jgi:hypothetical protein
MDVPYGADPRTVLASDGLGGLVSIDVPHCAMIEHYPGNANQVVFAFDPETVYTLRSGLSRGRRPNATPVNSLFSAPF